VEQVLGWANSVRAATLQFFEAIEAHMSEEIEGDAQQIHQPTPRPGNRGARPEIEQLPKDPTTWRPLRTVP
jgi:hypothetical protein